MLRGRPSSTSRRGSAHRAGTDLGLTFLVLSTRYLPMQYKSMTVRGKLTLAFGSLALAVLLVAALAVSSLLAANDRFIGFVRGINARAQLAEKVRTAVDRRAIAARNLVLELRAGVDAAHE